MTKADYNLDVSPVPVCPVNSIQDYFPFGFEEYEQRSSMALFQYRAPQKIVKCITADAFINYLQRQMLNLISLFYVSCTLNNIKDTWAFGKGQKDQRFACLWPTSAR